MFKQAIEFAQVTQTSQTAWATTYLNLGTCHRKLGCVSTPICSLASISLDILVDKMSMRRLVNLKKPKSPTQKC